MKTKNTAESRIKRKKFALVTKFAFIISISIAFTVFFVAAFNNYASTIIVEQYKADKKSEFRAISNLVHKKYDEVFFGGNEVPESFKNFISGLIENNLVFQVRIVNKVTDKQVWSSNEFVRKKDINTREQRLEKFSFDSNDHILTVTFLQDKAVLSLVNVLKNGNYMLAATFIIFGVLSASLLARQVTKPIEELVTGVWEFSKGNLEYRTSIKTDDEIGILAKTFNYMAEKLNELYTSLEKKVRERTAQLSSKNEELNRAYEELKDAQALLVHNEKMRSLGELVAGVAHELNNPINFIYGNMTHLNEYSENLIAIISKYEEIEKTFENGNFDEIKKFKDEIEYDFIKEDIQELIKSCIEGAERSKHIVLELKDFSRLDQGVIKEIDVNESIDSTLNILSNKYKNRVNIEKGYGELPMLNCHAGQLNQVFMNVLDNAAQAIEENGKVCIKTGVEDDNIVIIIEDTGTGIDEEVLPKIFDPFFTTKAVGSGSGLGLSISYKIVKSHNGTIDVESEKGKGTKFTIEIPKNWEQQQKTGETEKAAHE